MEDSEPPYKKIKLSLERPYKDEEGNPIPVLLDITPEGEHIYETKESPSKILGEKLRRIFVERGVDFFDRQDGDTLEDSLPNAGDPLDNAEDASESKTAEKNAIMSTEDLFKMRMEILPQLFIALGEITHARELLNMMLSSLPPSTGPESLSTLSSTFVSKPPPIVSVEAFNSQLVIGGKDEALRKAAGVFKDAADRMEKGRLQSEKYWVDALKIRKENWGLVPAPLPFGSATGKGSDKTSKDFIISYGLEESPPAFRRRAIAQMAGYDNPSDGLVFPFRQNCRLQVSLSISDVASGTLSTASNAILLPIAPSLEDELKSAQIEIVEQEIFTLLVSEASNLPSVSARVSERLIILEAAQGTELKFELIDVEQISNESSGDPFLTAKCHLIYCVLQALLLRRHSRLKSQRLGTEGIFRPSGSNEVSKAPLLLHPIIDLLQYQVFCQRVKTEIDTMVRALTNAGVPSTLRFNPVGEIGRDLIKILSDTDRRALGGEGVLRIDNRHTVRLTFVAPSTLTAHLSQATLTISSIPQLYQLLVDEIERYILQRICQLGKKMSAGIGGIWFVDLNRCVGRWEGSVLNFRIFYSQESQINCTAFQLSRQTAKKGETDAYNSGLGSELFSWVEKVIEKSLKNKT